MIRILAATALSASLAAAAQAQPVLPVDIRNASDCDIAVSVSPHRGTVAAPAGQTARLLVESPPQADGSNAVYRLQSRASAEGCDAKLQKPEMDWLLVRTPDGSFYVNPADPAKPDAASDAGSGTPTLVFAAAKAGEIALTLTTE